MGRDATAPPRAWSGSELPGYPRPAGRPSGPEIAMLSALHALCLALVLGAPPLDTQFVQLAPPPKVAAAVERHDQEDFLRSLSTEGRQRCLKQRSGKKIPDGVEFVCVVATRGLNGDNLVTCPCQWTEDLQGQGVPAVAVELSHHKAIASDE